MCFSLVKDRRTMKFNKFFTVSVEITLSFLFSLCVFFNLSVSASFTENANTPIPDKTITRIATFGDSITYGFNGSTRAQNPWPNLVGNDLHVPVDNRGVNSARITDIGSGQTTLSDEISGINPKDYSDIVISLGVNDFDDANSSNGFANLNQIESTLKNQILRIRDANLAIRIFGILPMQAWARTQNLDEKGPAGFSQNDLDNALKSTYESVQVTVLDWRDNPIVNDGNRSTLLGDKIIHPTQDGYNLMAARISGVISNEIRYTDQNGNPYNGLHTNADGSQSYFENGQKFVDHFLWQDNHMYYFNPDGTMSKNQFYSNWGNLYYFDSNGIRYTDQFYYNWGHTYYFGDGGVRATSTTEIIGDNLWSFDNLGIGTQLKDHFYDPNGKMYYFGPDGKEYKDQFYNNWGNTYYFGPDGIRYTDQFYYNWGHTYYFGDGGVRATSTTEIIGDNLWSFDNLGIGTQLKDHFFSQNGKMYYFGPDGKEYKDQFYNNWGNTYYFGPDGARYTDQFYSNWGHTYYFGDGGVRYTNRFYYNWGHTYYFGDGGVRLDNQNKWIDGKLWHFDNQGIGTIIG
ncbi:hypothetical protein GB993_05450 [Lactobacillus rossiae]|nr:hypothetical protein [Furfurilactobacillus milii]